MQWLESEESTRHSLAVLRISQRVLLSELKVERGWTSEPGPSLFICHSVDPNSFSASTNTELTHACFDLIWERHFGLRLSCEGTRCSEKIFSVHRESTWAWASGEEFGIWRSCLIGGTDSWVLVNLQALDRLECSPFLNRVRCDEERRGRKFSLQRAEPNAIFQSLETKV